MALIPINPFGSGSTEPAVPVSHTGSINAAISYAELYESTPFIWLLRDVDQHDNPMTKVIWHIGDCVFVDAAGSVIYSPS